LDLLYHFSFDNARENANNIIGDLMISVVIRTLLLYFAVTFSIRIMGKRQIGDMQPNELVITLLISEIAAIPLQDMSQPILFGLLPIFLLVVIEITLSVLVLKSSFLRRLISGRSVIIIKNGVIDQNAMKNLRLTILDLIELLRGQNVFDISTVAFAVMEVNGDLSVLLKSSEQPATAKDVGAKNATASLPLPVICDGKIVKESLIALQLSNGELENRIKLANTEIKKIFLMTLDRNGNSNIINMRDKK
jgi:uncharacterized membrane protein YcaP (DUF421 family)